jgi:hypothetical protein
MGKSQQSQAESMANQNYNQANAQSNEMRQTLMGQLPGQQQQAQALHDTASQSYTGFTGGYGSYNPSEYEGIKSQNTQNITSGGYNPEQLSTLRGETAGEAATGGYTPGEVSTLTAGGIGGMSPEQVAAVRGGYQNLMATGGLSDATADAMRRQAAGSAQGVYATMGQNLARQQGIAGTGGAGGETAEMARQAGQEAATATTGANAQIGQLRQQGEIAGTQGLGQFETGVGAANRAALSDIAAGRRAGVSEQAGVEANVAKGTLTASQANQDLATNAATQRIQAAGGLVNLYQSQPGYVTSLVNSIIQQQQVGGQLTTQQAQIMDELSKNPGLFANIMQGVTSLGGAAGGVMTGIGSIKGKG